MMLGDFSDSLVDLAKLPEKEKLRVVEEQGDRKELQVNAWEFYKFLLRNKDIIWSVMVNEEELTIQSVSSKWKEMLEECLVRIGKINLDLDNSEKRYLIVDDLTFDQVLVACFNCFQNDMKCIGSGSRWSVRNAVLNKWMKELPFLSQYFCVDNRGEELFNLFPLKWNLLLDDKSDVYGVVELVLQYSVLKLHLVQVEQFIVVGSPDVQSKLQFSFDCAVSKLKVGPLNDWNTDFFKPKTSFVFEDYLDTRFPVLECSNRKFSFPCINYDSEL